MQINEVGSSNIVATYRGRWVFTITDLPNNIVQIQIDAGKISDKHLDELLENIQVAVTNK